jgi:hypothetical protein
MARFMIAEKRRLEKIWFNFLTFYKSRLYWFYHERNH